MTDDAMILAPLRGVTIRAFRETFAAEIAASGFGEAFTPFVAAMRGVDPLKDRELVGVKPDGLLRVTPQFIGKDPEALRTCLKKIKDAGFQTADLNCGCPFPMVRNKGRGSGILRTPDVLRAMLDVGCEEMGAGRFSIKARLGVERADELLRLMPFINCYPLRFLTIHARTARQMYAGECDLEAAREVIAAAKVPVVANGDLTVLEGTPEGCVGKMVGRSFLRELGAREDAGTLLRRYVEFSRTELSGDRPVLGRLKELVAYWKELPNWKKRWNVIKLARTVDEFVEVASR